jgi:hypothetical protein
LSLADQHIPRLCNCRDNSQELPRRHSVGEQVVPRGKQSGDLLPIAQGERVPGQYGRLYFCVVPLQVIQTLGGGCRRTRRHRGRQSEGTGPKGKPQRVTSHSRPPLNRKSLFGPASRHSKLRSEGKPASWTGRRQARRFSDRHYGAMIDPCPPRVVRHREQADPSPRMVVEQLLVCLEVRTVSGAIQHVPTALLHEHLLERQGWTSASRRAAPCCRPRDVLREGDACRGGGGWNLHRQIDADAQMCPVKHILREPLIDQLGAGLGSSGTLRPGGPPRAEAREVRAQAGVAAPTGTCPGRAATPYGLKRVTVTV